MSTVKTSERTADFPAHVHPVHHSPDPQNGQNLYTPSEGISFSQSGQTSTGEAETPYVPKSSVKIRVSDPDSDASEPAFDDWFDPLVDSVVDALGDSVVDAPVESAFDPLGDSVVDALVESAFDPLVVSAFDPLVESAFESVDDPVV